MTDYTYKGKPGEFHPGEILQIYLERDHLSHEDLSKRTLLSKKIIHGIVFKEWPIVLEVAVRLSMIFEDTSVDFWMNLQSDWEEEQNKKGIKLDWSRIVDNLYLEICDQELDMHFLNVELAILNSEESYGNA